MQAGQATLLEMARCWGVGESQNGEVAMRWAQLVAKNNLTQALPQGRPQRTNPTQPKPRLAQS